jgi:hypothetical protein
LQQPGDVLSRFVDLMAGLWHMSAWMNKSSSSISSGSDWLQALLVEALRRLFDANVHALLRA